MKFPKLFNRGNSTYNPIQQRLDRFTAESLHVGAVPRPVRIGR